MTAVHESHLAENPIAGRCRIILALVRPMFLLAGIRAQGAFVTAQGVGGPTPCAILLLCPQCETALKLPDPLAPRSTP
jgi:hypothetical protein